MSTWSFVRHGESEANAEGQLAGFFDSPLTDLGRAQADELHPLVSTMKLDLVLTSDLRRAKETALRLRGDRPVRLEVSPELRERNAGAFEGRSAFELRQAGLLEPLNRWHGRPPGGESLAEIATRAVRYLSKHDGDHEVLVVAHGALIRALLHAIDHDGRGEPSDFRPMNCELISRDLPPGFFRKLLARVFPEDRKSGRPRKR